MTQTEKAIIKNIYVVCDENTLGYKTESGMIGILHQSVLRGASFAVHPEPKHKTQFSTIREAVKSDFTEYRVQPPEGLFE